MLVWGTREVELGNAERTWTVPTCKGKYGQLVMWGLWCKELRVKEREEEEEGFPAKDTWYCLSFRFYL